MAKITLKRYNGALWEEMKVASEWDIVGGKPETFPPSGHGHNAGDIDGGVLNSDVIPNISISKIKTDGSSTDILIGTPEGGIGLISQNTFAQATHPHNSTDITNFNSAVLALSPSGSRPASDVYAWAKKSSLALTDVPIISVAKGGTGSTTAAGARSNLGIGTIGTKNSLLESDIPSLNASKITTGTLPVARGGTGRTSYTSGQVLYASGTSTIGMLSRDGIDTRTSFPTDTMKLIRGRSSSSALTGVGNGDDLGIIVLDEYVTWGDTLFIEVLGKTGSASYTPKIVGITLRSNTTSPNSNTEYYTASFSTYNGTNFNIYSFTVAATGAELYFGSKKLLTGSFSGTTINWYTSTYTLYIGRVWKV